ncbi:hypothetical protein [Flavobacterium segetis]|uniref:hypothetical protein n=1 Tax=Flavobacterium segetis TaxID=271157 RepID=UPI00093478CA|nr:hypothetical protein [Flavobacterium segetis]
MKKFPFRSFKNSQIILVKGRKIVYLIIQHITGIPRNQMCSSSLEDTILPDNPVRFVDALSVQTLVFTIHTINT